uniref:Adherens junction-associated protein 1 n=1 Tax=Sphaerodactylus townsendi TaxID=933632 RepID=A0ACB8EES3_9SAUR
MICAQSGNTRRNSHQRKINQQEESCQNLTDFTPARVPSNLDIFTAYNETLQCSHECVRTPVPVYTEETILPPGDYKTSFNGNSRSTEIEFPKDKAGLQTEVKIVAHGFGESFLALQSSFWESHE